MKSTKTTKTKSKKSVKPSETTKEADTHYLDSLFDQALIYMEDEKLQPEMREFISRLGDIAYYFCKAADDSLTFIDAFGQLPEASTKAWVIDVVTRNLCLAPEVYNDFVNTYCKTGRDWECGTPPKLDLGKL